MGFDDAGSLDEAVERGIGGPAAACLRSPKRALQGGAIVVVAACLVFCANIASPPHLMDDVDAVQAQIARNMLDSGDWVTARLDGVAYLEKSPLIYWMMAASYRAFGVHDWAARLPLALAVVLLCWVTYRFGRWAFSARASTGESAWLPRRDFFSLRGFSFPTRRLPLPSLRPSGPGCGYWNRTRRGLGSGR